MMQSSPSDDGEIRTTQGICPDDWHIPTETEWKTLKYHLWKNVGGKMKEIGIVHWHVPNSGATNESGFTALPGGYRYIGGSLHAIGIYAYF